MKVSAYPVGVRSLCCLGLAVALSSVAGAGAAAERPNIVLIMTDDQGYGDLGVTGNPVVETPHIDALAAGAASMQTFYVSPVCSPTRAALMTGRYAYRTRVIDTYKGRSMMEPEEVTVAELLGADGYATGIFGKWHLGDCYPMRPMDQGFEEALVHRGGGLAQPSEPIENGRRYTDPILVHNGEQVSTKGYCTDVYFAAAQEFIGRAQTEDRPFFAYIAPNAPHGPFHDVPEALYEKYREKDLSSVLLGREQDADTVARVFAMVENIDQNVGRLMEALEERGLLENTLVIFMVDNGPNTRRYVGPMRGKKSEVHEGGIRSPFFVHWPARLTAGAVSDRIAAHIDVTPTLLAAAGVEVPEGVRFDGRSLLPLLEGRETDWPDRALILQTHRGDEPVRFHHVAVRSQRWKLVHPTGFGRDSMPKDQPVELYDLKADVGESANVAGDHPGVVARLRSVYEQWFDDVSSTRSDNYDPPRIVLGTDRETETVLTWQDWRVLDSAGWGRQGEWWLRFAGEGRYTVECRWPEPVGPAELELRLGSISRTATLAAGVTEVRFEELSLPKGEAELRVTVRRGEKEEGPYQVVLTRRQVAN